jgi:hypothetical protein
MSTLLSLVKIIVTKINQSLNLGYAVKNENVPLYKKENPKKK